MWPLLAFGSLALQGYQAIKNGHTADQTLALQIEREYRLAQEAKEAKERQDAIDKDMAINQANYTEGLEDVFNPNKKKKKKDDPFSIGGLNQISAGGQTNGVV